MSKPIGWRRLTDAEKQEIVARYSAGEGLEALALEYHRSKETLKPILRSAGLTLRPRGNPKGTVWSDERRDAHRRACTTPEFAQKSRENLVKRLPSMRGPATNTPIELRLHDALKAAGIGFATQVLLLGRYLADALVSQAPVVIEADGSGHLIGKQPIKDAERDAALVAAGYRVFRFTGSELNTDATACVARVIEACGLVPEEAPDFTVRTVFSGENHPRWKGGKREFTCDVCGEVFLAQPTHRRGLNCYCSRQCAGKARKGQSLSAEHRAAIRTGLTGNVRAAHTAEAKARMGASVSSALKGKPKSAEHRAKISAALRRRNSQIKIESDLTRDRESGAEMTSPATLF